MITLIIDTSHSVLAVGLVKDNELLDSIQEVLKKKHSERLVCAIDELFFRNQLDKQSIDTIVVTDGPGSYTGMRIGMTFTKVLALTLNVSVYTVDSLQALVGASSAFSFIDARSNRVFGAYIQDGKIEQERIYSTEELGSVELPLVGDVHLLGEETIYPNICANILSVKNLWRPVDNVDLLVPRYLS